MNIPVEAKPAAWGAVGGAIAAMVVGFNWGGWVTGGTADTASRKQADEAVVGALAPVCLERCNGTPDAGANRAVLKKTETWSQGEFVEKGGWARMPGASTPERASAVARACATLIIGA